MVNKESKKKSVNYFVFKFDPENESHGFWRIENGIKCLKDSEAEYWTSPIPSNPAPKYGDKIIIWESRKFYIRGVATVVHDKEKDDYGGYVVLIEYENLFKENPYTEIDAKKDGVIECFYEIKGKNDQRSKKLIPIDLSPQRLYELLLNRKGLTNQNVGDRETPPDVQVREIDETRKKEIGCIGEKIVLESEKNRLAALGKTNLADKVEDVSKFNLGYDILSFEKNGSKRYIEVKSTMLSDNYKFLITKNERNYMNANKNSWLYSVVNVNLKTKSGVIKEKIRIDELEENYIFSPEVFKVKKKP